MNIEIIQEKNHKSLMEYESDIVPMIGDSYAGMLFPDGHQRTIVRRLLFTHPGTNSINVYVEHTFPELVKTIPNLNERKTELNETESSHAIQITDKALS